MKNILTITSLLFAGTLAANAATLLGSWDFSTASMESNGTIAATAGNLTMDTYGQQIENGVLKFSPSATTDYAHISLGDSQIGPASGNDGNAFTIVLTLTSLNIPTSGTNILWSAKDGSNDFRTGLAVTSAKTSTMWQGSSSNRGSTTELQGMTISEESPLTVRAYYSDSGCKVYFNDKLAITDGGVKWKDTGYLTDMYLGNWSSGQENAIATMDVSSFSVYKGEYVPEPSAFGLLAGLGALALVASRRRRR